MPVKVIASRRVINIIIFLFDPMFLTRVYRYNKWLFAGMLFFIAMQLFVFYKQGMVISPWFNYGMYSEVIAPQKEYIVYKIYADGKLMQGADYSPQQWDAIHFALSQADATACNGNFYDKQISRLFKKAQLPVPDKDHYVNTLFNAEEIQALFASYLAKKFRAKQIKIIPMLYVWDGQSLIEKHPVINVQSNSFQCK